MKKLTKHGNSWALVIDRPILDLLGIDPESTPVDITTDGSSLLVAPVRDERRERAFRAALKRSNRKYGRR